MALLCYCVVCVIKMYNMWALLTLCLMTLSYYMDNFSWTKTILRFRTIVLCLLPLYKKHHTSISYGLTQSSPLLPCIVGPNWKPVWRHIFITLQIQKCLNVERGVEEWKKDRKRGSLYTSLLNSGLISFRKYLKWQHSLNEKKKNTRKEQNTYVFVPQFVVSHLICNYSQCCFNGR